MGVRCPKAKWILAVTLCALIPTVSFPVTPASMPVCTHDRIEAHVCCAHSPRRAHGAVHALQHRVLVVSRVARYPEGRPICSRQATSSSLPMEQFHRYMDQARARPCRTRKMTGHRTMQAPALQTGLRLIRSWGWKGAGGGGKLVAHVSGASSSEAASFRGTLTACR